MEKEIKKGRDYKRLDPNVAQGFSTAKIENKKTGKITLTRIHPNKEAEYKKAGWTIEKPIEFDKMPVKKNNKALKDAEARIAELEAKILADAESKKVPTK